MKHCTADVHFFVTGSIIKPYLTDEH